MRGLGCYQSDLWWLPGDLSSEMALETLGYRSQGGECLWRRAVKCKLEGKAEQN